MNWRGNINNINMPIGITSPEYNVLSETPIGNYQLDGSLDLSIDNNRWFSTTFKYSKDTLEVYVNNIKLIRNVDYAESDGTLDKVKNKDFYLNIDETSGLYLTVTYTPRDKQNGYEKMPSDILMSSPQLIINRNSSQMLFAHINRLDEQIKSIETVLAKEGYMSSRNTLYHTVGTSKIINRYTIINLIDALMSISDYLGANSFYQELRLMKTEYYEKMFSSHVIKRIRHIIEKFLEMTAS